MKILLSILSLGLMLPDEIWSCSILHEYRLAPNLQTIAVIAKVEGIEKTEDLRDEIDTKELKLKIQTRIQYPQSLPDGIFARLYGHEAACGRKYMSSEYVVKNYPVGTELLILGQIEYSNRKNNVILEVDQSFAAENKFENQPIFTSVNEVSFEKVVNNMQRCRTERISKCHNIWVAYDIGLVKMLQELSSSQEIQKKKSILLTILQPGFFKDLEVDGAIELYFSDKNARSEIRKKYKARLDVFNANRQKKKK